MENFNGGVWGNNGPFMLTRVFHKHCKLPNNNFSDVDFRCDALDMQIFPVSMAYAMFPSAKEMKKFFDSKKTKEVLEIVGKSHFVHLTSSKSSAMNMTKNSDYAYRYLAEKLCPRIFDVSDVNFQ
jgi:lactosylceramide 4-alpha-galactosyltransferase